MFDGLLIAHPVVVLPIQFVLLNKEEPSPIPTTFSSHKWMNSEFHFHDEMHFRFPLVIACLLSYFYFLESNVQYSIYKRLTLGCSIFFNDCFYFQFPFQAQFVRCGNSEGSCWKIWNSLGIGLNAAVCLQRQEIIHQVLLTLVTMR